MKLIGTSGVIQNVLTHKFTRLRARVIAGEKVSVLERRQLLTGPPGVGKSELATEISLLISGHAMAVEKKNGTNVSVDVVREWTRQSSYRPMPGMGDLTVKFVDEVEGVKTDALNDLRTYLDDLPNHTVFICTTNKQVAHLPEQLQSRFQVWTFAPIEYDLIVELLMQKHELPLLVARDIARRVKGNVRAAEEDAVSHLDVLAAKAAHV